MRVFRMLISLRLARILFARDKFDEALRDSANAKNVGSYESPFQELAGDIYFKQGEMNQEAFVSLLGKAKDTSQKNRLKN